ncbi:MAG TPA: thermonuclease family protein [Phnomibacter sp.]|nr:thermonuclease family protein [Phnomibacter sp.]
MHRPFFITCLFIALSIGLVVPACGYRSTAEENIGQTAASPDPVSLHRIPSPASWYRILRFVDGDTFWLDDSTATGTKVRLIGMDTPELKNAGKKKKHPMGRVVADHVQQKLAGQLVRVELDVQKHDQYGRVLVYMFLQDGTHLNAHLLQMGYAVLMTVPPNVKYADTFYRLQVEAREAGRGVWKME